MYKMTTGFYSQTFIMCQPQKSINSLVLFGTHSFCSINVIQMSSLQVDIEFIELHQSTQSVMNLRELLKFHSPVSSPSFTCPPLSGCREFAPSSRSTEMDTKQVKTLTRVRLLVGLVYCLTGKIFDQPCSISAISLCTCR